MNPRNGFAKSHLGFILKADHLRYTEAIPLLRDGISSGEPGADDGRFYFHLGDALTRIGKPDEVRFLACLCIANLLNQVSFTAIYRSSRKVPSPIEHCMTTPKQLRRRSLTAVIILFSVVSLFFTVCRRNLWT